jgi:SPP1 family predicted phage head-tail adaptor
MRAGKLRHIVDFEAKVTTLDSDGRTVETWVGVFDAPLRCSVEALSGRELIAAASVNSKVNTRIVTRYKPGIEASQRAVLAETYFNIEAVIPDPHSRNRHVTLLCSSGVNLG